jgi:ADP-ribose pyrophosphatase
MQVNKKELRLWKTVSKRVILQYGKYLTVENHTVELPDGQIIPDWAWLISPDAAIILAITTENKFICFRQTKYAIEGTSLAPAAGMIEPGEAPLNAAKRELLEETGYEAPDWVNLGSYVLDPNRGMGTDHLFLALNAKRVAEPNSDDLEDQELLFLGQDEIEKALKAGEFKVMSWAAAAAMALNYLNGSRDQT